MTAAEKSNADANADTYYSSGSALIEAKRFDQALVAFDQTVALKPDYAEAHNGRGITLASLNRFDEALTALERAIAVKPDYAEAYNNRGLILHASGRFDDALTSFDRAIALKPDNPHLYNNRGAVLLELQRRDEALASFEKSIALKPDYAPTYYNSGILLQDLMRLDESLARFDRAVSLQPDYAEAHHNRGAVLQDMRRPADAIAAYDKALGLLPAYAEAYSNQSHCYLQMGRFEQGWRLNEWRKKLEVPLGHRLFPQPLWLGAEDLGAEDIANKTLFVHWEQGLGDTIQFCRYGKLLSARGAKVVMSVQQSLHELLQHLDPGVAIINDDEVPAAFDYHCPLMSLPLALGTTLDTIPAEQRYIFADKERRATWNTRLPPPTKPRIGVVWRGSTKHKNDANRSIALSALAPLFSADAHWLSLQKDLGPADTALLGKLSHVSSCGDELKDFSDTAAVIDLLDLVITVDTSVAHLAGAMGKPVWILLPYNSDWRWLLDRDDSPWYPSARLFRQKDTRSWADVVTRVGAALDDVLRSRG
jgi:tetratricopeptide (TPR) repeat protein